MREGDTAFLYELARDSEELKLLEYLADAEKPIIRYRAAELLGGLRTGTNSQSEERIGTALLRTAKNDESDDVRAAAIDAMYLRDEGYLERLIEEVAASEVNDPPKWMDVDRVTDWLAADQSEFRMVAAAAVGRIGDDTAVPALVDAVADADVRVRTKAAEACGKIGDPRAIDALASRLDDPQNQVRRAAAAALASIGTRRAVEALAPAARSETESVRVIAVGELDRFGSLEPLPLLVEALEDGSELVRRTATRTILELLANAPAERSHDVRHEVAEGIFDASPPDLAAQLLTILQGNQPAYIRRNATWLLGRVAENEREYPDGVVDYLIRALDDEDELTAKFALSTLVELEDPSLLERLREFLERDDVSEAATSRAEFVRKKRAEANRPSREAVTNSVEYTYVSDPSDYTAKKRERGSGSSTDAVDDSDSNE
ncbi:phycocyanin alpha phycocyanobilin lyase [Halobiforma lacisalsi AJ5]|uniref:Phycocyanin alpha phycocyanobilin lyase n=1 Tax=Natronobacterium lacisalsi AJ5 TaxID=358396 RepID=M0LCP0_NATLA|nr:HEAT repeat domain-containing protein [Halobiforma lacisalsi]APW98984.1 phycocyanin alpha phycocyanobilin lyase [Halobiforma lacisalsi AJ5]EMA30194.1 phycocyanin alpha phycocyanobilin lyase-like protein [Halobiforma lacisalsi AJ5]